MNDEHESEGSQRIEHAELSRESIRRETMCREDSYQLPPSDYYESMIELDSFEPE
jgi:hypothetical protein